MSVDKAVQRINQRGEAAASTYACVGHDLLHVDGVPLFVRGPVIHEVLVLSHGVCVVVPGKLSWLVKKSELLEFVTQSNDERIWSSLSADNLRLGRCLIGRLDFRQQEDAIHWGPIPRWIQLVGVIHSGPGRLLVAPLNSLYTIVI